MQTGAELPLASGCVIQNDVWNGLAMSETRAVGIAPFRLPTVRFPRTSLKLWSRTPFVRIAVSRSKAKRSTISSRSRAKGGTSRKTSQRAAKSATSRKGSSASSNSSSDALDSLPLLNAGQFARLCGVSTGLISKWCNEGMPCVRSGQSGAEVRINLLTAMPWVTVTRARDDPERDAWSKAKREKLELETAQRRGDLIPKADVEDVLLNLSDAVGQRCDQVPGRVSNEFAAERDAAVIFERTVDELRPVKAAFAEMARELAIAFEGLAEAPAEPGRSAAETKRGTVGRSESDSSAGQRGAGPIPQ